MRMMKTLETTSWCFIGLVALCLLGLAGLTMRDVWRLCGLQKRITRAEATSQHGAALIAQIEDSRHEGRTIPGDEA